MAENYEYARNKIQYLHFDEYAKYCKRLNNLLKYEKINLKLYTTCQWEAYDNLQKTFLGRW